MGHGKAQRTERLCCKIPAHSVLEPWHWTQTLTDSRHITFPQESKSSCVTLITRLRNMGKTMQKWKAYRIYKRPTPPPPHPRKSNKLMFLNQYAAKRIPKNPKMCDPILITLLKIRPHYGQSKHTRHCIELLRGTKGQTSQVIDMQLCTLSIKCYRIGCRKRTLTFRSFISGFAASDFTGFGRIPMFTMGKKIEIVSLVIRFYGII